MVDVGSTVRQAPENSWEPGAALSAVGGLAYTRTISYSPLAKRVNPTGRCATRPTGRHSPLWQWPPPHTRTPNASRGCGGLRAQRASRCAPTGWRAMTALIVSSARRSAQRDDKVVELATGWALWRDFAVRSAGFPVSGLEAFGSGDESARLRSVARDRGFREAVNWQNPAALANAVVKVAENVPTKPAAARRRSAASRCERAPSSADEPPARHGTSDRHRQPGAQRAARTAIVRNSRVSRQARARQHTPPRPTSSPSRPVKTPFIASVCPRFRRTRTG